MSSLRLASKLPNQVAEAAHIRMTRMEKLRQLHLNKNDDAYTNW